MKETDCQFKTIRDWPGCYEDCLYAGMDKCPYEKDAYEKDVKKLLKDLVEAIDCENDLLAYENIYQDFTKQICQLETSGKKKKKPSS